MPEIKNNFLQGKMNKDLDDRLLPNGQYRDAKNITVSKSENSDAGTVQNIKGNKLAYGNSLNLNDGHTEVIGYYADSFSGDIFWFVTNFSKEVTDDVSDSGVTGYYVGTNLPAPLNSVSTICRIYYANANSEQQPIIIIDSYRLNFNKNYKIHHINKLDNLLFWTDDYNQPRRLNISDALSSNNPYTNDIYLEDKISVAQYAPYAAPKVSLSYDSTIKSKHIQEEFVKFAYRFKYDNNEYSLISPFTQHCFHPGKPTQTFNDGTYSTATDSSSNATMAGMLGNGDLVSIVKNTVASNMVNKANKVSLLITLPFDETITNHASAKADNGSGLTGTTHTIDTVAGSGTIAANNIMLTDNDDLYVINSFTAGDPDSTLVTTTSISPAIPDDTNLYFFNVGVESPYGWSNKLKIKEIEILYSESDSAAIKVIDRIEIKANTAIKPVLEIISSTSAKLRYTYEYIYKSTKPTKTLPEADLTRVNDVIPIKAKTQEISGNRIIYGNFLQNRKTSNIIPNQQSFSISSGNQSVQNKEYLLSSLKSNRTYQVGIVLSDRYGRQSPVIVPEESTTFMEPLTQTPSPFVVTNGTSSWTHHCLRASFTELGNDIYNESTNPLGWYSYRFVVKQTEQEYYNVYTPQVIRAGSPILPSNYRSFLHLHGDNINKVPRDVTDINTETGVQGSQVRLLPRVIDNDLLNLNQFANITQLDTTDFIDITSIGSARDNSLTDDIDSGNATDVLHEIYLSETNPLMAELPGVYGDTWQDWKTSSHDVSLNVFETSPFVSVIDIYYETSSCGLLKDLEEKIAASAGEAPTDITIDSNTFSESSSSGTTIGALTARKSNGDPVSPAASFVINSAIDGLGNDRSADFAISSNNLNTNTTFEFKNTNADNITINITATRGGTTETKTKDISVSLQNAAPTVNVGSSPKSITAVSSGQSTGITITGTNGSAKTSANTNGLTFSIVSQTNSGRYTINSTTGVISAGVNLTDGMSDTLTLKVTDVGGTDSSTANLVINAGVSLTQFWRSSNGYYNGGDADDSGNIVQEPTGIQVWHNGTGDLPRLGIDTVYSNVNGTNPFDSAQYWHSLCGPSFCSANQATKVFKTNSNGLVTALKLG